MDHPKFKLRAFFRRAETYVELDLRSLALFRILLGLLVLVDLTLKAQDLTLLFTDQGALPVNFLSFPETFSLFSVSGSPAYVWGLFVFGYLLTVAFTLGWAYRIAAPLLWFFVISLQHRNLSIIEGFDVYVRFLLLWSVFLPLNAVWSMDARKRPGLISFSFASWGTLAITLQIAVVYLLNFRFKLTSYWLSGKAVENILSYWPNASAMGERLLAFPILLEWGNYFTLFVEFSVPLLLLFPIKKAYCRAAAALMLLFLHMGILFSMNVTLFSLLSISAAALFVPQRVWNKLPAPVHGKGLAWGLTPRSLSVLWLMLFIIQYWNLNSLLGYRLPDFPRLVHKVRMALKLGQDWKMYYLGRPEESWPILLGQKGMDQVYLLSQLGPDNRPVFVTHRQKKLYFATALHPTYARAKYQTVHLDYFCRAYDLESVSVGKGTPQAVEAGTPLPCSSIAFRTNRRKH